VWPGRGRRKSETGSRPRRQKKQLNARWKESVKGRLATLKKLYNCPKEATAQPLKLLQSKRSLRVVLWVLVVIRSLRRLLRQLALTQPAAAAPPPYIIDLYEGTLFYRSIVYYYKISHDNNYCMWLYSLIFVVGVKARSGRSVSPGVRCPCTVQCTDRCRATAVGEPPTSKHDTITKL
jgi:hypothetical protein